MNDVDALRGAGHRDVEQTALLGLSTVLESFHLLVGVGREQIDLRRFQPLCGVNRADAYLLGMMGCAGTKRPSEQVALTRLTSWLEIGSAMSTVAQKRLFLTT